VLGEYLAGAEGSVRIERPLRDHPLALLEKVGQQAGVGNRNGLRGIGDAKAHGQAVRLAGQTAGLDQSADAKRPALRCFVRRDLRRREKEYEIGAKGVEHQCGGHRERGQAADDPTQAPRPRLHRARSSARAARRALESRTRTATISAASSTAVSPYEPQT